MTHEQARPVLSWFGIIRLGLVQTGLGAIVVLTTSTLNRVMVVELAMPAILPGALVAIHYVLQVFRPAWGHGSDLGARRTPWIVGGMAVLATGGLLAAVATAWMETHPLFGVALAVVAFCLIGAGVGAAGTSLLVLLAKRTDEKRRAAAATLVWVMMIAGFIITTGVAGQMLDPFSPLRLVVVSGCVSDRGNDPDHDRGVGHRAAYGHRHRRTIRTKSATPKILVPSRPSWKYGPSRKRGDSRFSCSSRCWPIARRI